MSSLTSGRLREDSRNWFEKYDQLKNVLRPTDGEGRGYERIKIAVLDTGIRQEDYDYLKECPSPPKYRDFVDAAQGDITCDKTGHGSAGISLLITTCPDASLYIARVLRSNVATMADVDRVAQLEHPLPPPPPTPPCMTTNNPPSHPFGPP